MLLHVSVCCIDIEQDIAFHSSAGSKLIGTIKNEITYGNTGTQGKSPEVLGVVLRRLRIVKHTTPYGHNCSGENEEVFPAQPHLHCLLT